MAMKPTDTQTLRVIRMLVLAATAAALVVTEAELLFVGHTNGNNGQIIAVILIGLHLSTSARRSSGQTHRIHQPKKLMTFDEHSRQGSPKIYRSTLYLPAIVTLILILAGVFYRQAAWRQDRLLYPQIGQSIDLGGRTLNIYCSGEGSLAVVFDTFSHQAGMTWIAVQPQVANFTRACWYDRAGYGWSDPGPLPRTFKAVATDLHALLHAAHIPPPYVLVGAHDATSNIRVYNGHYPNEVAGAVFIDGNDVDEYAHHIDAPHFIKGPGERLFGRLNPYVLGSACIVLPTASRVAWLLPKFGRLGRTLAYGLSSDQQAELDFLSDRAFADACDMKQNEEDVRNAGNFGNHPLIAPVPRQEFIPRGENAREV